MSKKLFRVTFINQGKVYEVFARKVYASDLYGFVTVEQLRFGERSGVVVDPGEERLRDEFQGVERFHVPMHAVVRVDEVQQAGVAKVHELGDKVAPFPGPLYPPRKGGSDG
ncbi:MAG TPA: DUF1820 family protein [Chromatiales bacterium]|nr:DUF1820 family protein [Chromatiales bacterium]